MAQPHVIYQAKPGSALDVDRDFYGAAGARARQAGAGRAIRHPATLGTGVAGAGRPDLPHRGHRGAPGGGPQRVEPEQSARALLGVAIPPAAPGARVDLRSAVVVPALPAADAHDHRRHRAVRPGRRRRRLPRPARHALRPVRAQAAQRRGVGRLLSQQPHACGPAVSPDRARRPRRPQRVPGDRPHRGGEVLHQAQPGARRRLHRVLRRVRRAGRALACAPTATCPSQCGARAPATAWTSAVRWPSRSGSRRRSCCAAGARRPCRATAGATGCARPENAPRISGRPSGERSRRRCRA